MAKRKENKEGKALGRPTILDKELIKEICGWIEQGNCYKDACLLSNISKSVFCSWKVKGKEDKDSGRYSIYAEFLDAVKRAKVKFKAWHIGQINTASKKGNWQASAWMLERMYRKQYGKRLEMTGEGGKPIEIHYTADFDGL